VFWDRTFGWQLSRSSPFSIWDWDQYPGYPNLHHVQTGLKIVLLFGALAVYFVPRVKNELQIAALSAALLIGFEAVLTHWFYLYIPWFFPFVAFAVLAPAVRSVVEVEPAPSGPEHEREVRELVPAS
jgi:energy-coupling factor transporter transmembrane protein EcfT